MPHQQLRSYRDGTFERLEKPGIKLTTTGLQGDIMLTCLCKIPPYTPLFYSKTGVYRGIHFFLIFALKHRLWVLVRTTSLRRFLRLPTINVLSKNKKNITIFHLKIIFFTAVKNCSIFHGHVFVMSSFTITSRRLLYFFLLNSKTHVVCK